MKTNRIVAALLCASLGLAATASFAQPAPGGPDQHGQYNQYNNNPGYHGGPGPQDHGPAPQMNDHRPPQHADVPPPHHGDWRKGDRLEQDYRNRQYVIDNWHEHDLRQPPRGYQWVGVNGNYLLVAAATGIIAQVVMSH
ncbi:putative transmembrane protein [Candidatus Burkholderia verschuerenii]|uniref:Putative transmembrane protein n=1 Tax=Candidatus Burkholderia verschuerenii TaxID=242163 RepID=A0A0L0MFN6_9BURK|nr:RcnB family protein [Candidatus Burkholderia verschuerenii]KND61111.1 putative transmembrane protein [Candidatus Burkholderia verschuerenii]